IVVILACATAETGTEHERTASPSTCTVQAPHCATPQPYLVPVRPTCSRITQSRGVVGSTSTSWDLPLMVRRIVFFLLVVPAANAAGAEIIPSGSMNQTVMFATTSLSWREPIMRCSTAIGARSGSLLTPRCQQVRRILHGVRIPHVIQENGNEELGSVERNRGVRPQARDSLLR